VLEELRIQSLGVIEDAVLPLGSGLTVVTGETGAGKTMVVTGLLLLFGGRADAARVRDGATQASVDGIVYVNDAEVLDRVRAVGGTVDPDDGVVLRRVVAAAGRSRAYVGGAPAPVAVLGELAENLVTVHGQSDQLRLTRRAEQVQALDRFGDIDTATFTEAFQHWRRAAGELEDRLARTGELRREADMLAYGLAEIEAVAPAPGEDVELAATAERLAHADALRLAARTAHNALAGDPDDPASDVPDVGALLGVARNALEQQSAADPHLAALAARAAELGTLAADLAGDLRDYADGLDTDPARLAHIEERRARVTGLVRKYADARADVVAVLAWAAHAKDRLGEIDVSDQALADLTAARDAAAVQTVRAADTLSAARREVAQRLDAAVTAELEGLAMSGAAFQAVVRPRARGQGTVQLGDGSQRGGEGTDGPILVGTDGADDVEFLLRPHAGAPPVPVARGASGGELSRVMLALEVCLAGTDPVPTMVFDEVDAGVGGRAAVEVGRRLARLARDHQVIVVTHLAQVAAYADRHVVVDKTASDSGGQDGSVTASDVRVVSDHARVAELARMLAGSDSPTALRHAEELLASAAEDQQGTGKPGR
jgi:DNA repair protein RecN (Recombination protein N)